MSLYFYKCDTRQFFRMLANHCKTKRRNIDEYQAPFGQTIKINLSRKPIAHIIDNYIRRHKL